MEGAVSERPVAPPLFERLDAVLDALTAQGLVIDIEQRVRLNGLLLRLITEQRLPVEMHDLGRLITPVLAGSPAEQVLCESTFKKVFADAGEPPPEPAPRHTCDGDTGLDPHGSRAV
jgi:hypothetical protein